MPLSVVKQKLIDLGGAFLNSFINASDEASARAAIKAAPDGYGLGVTPVATETDFNNYVKASGFYLTPDTSDMTNAPPITGRTLLITIGNTNYCDQIAYSANTGTVFRCYVRRYTNSVWSSWVEMYSSASVLGTVSQSGGIPTGAVIERGSNANGEYTKFADGTMICNITMNIACIVPSVNSYGTTSGGGFVTEDFWWTYPVAFSAIPKGSSNASGRYNHGGMSTHLSNIRVSSAVPRAWSSAYDTLLIDYQVIGRWF